MKVTHNDVPGNLLTVGGTMVFIPEIEPWGSNRLCIHDPIVALCGKDDDNCIWVKGRVPYAPDPLVKQSLWTHADWSFYPVTG